MHRVRVFVQEFRGGGKRGPEWMWVHAKSRVAAWVSTTQEGQMVVAAVRANMVPRISEIGRAGIVGIEFELKTRIRG